MNKLKTAVLISGNGTNLQSLINACKKDNYPAEIVLVVSNEDSAYGLKRAENNGIPAKVINHRNFSSRKEFDRAVSLVIEESGAEFICMAGFMRILSEWFIDKWYNKLINIHPSILPSFKGIEAQKQALTAGVKVTGCTVHFVRKEMDTGPIIIQETVPVFYDDTVAILTERILKKEHEIYIKALDMIAREVIHDEIVYVDSK